MIRWIIESRVERGLYIADPALVSNDTGITYVRSSAQMYGNEKIAAKYCAKFGIATYKVASYEASIKPVRKTINTELKQSSILNYPKDPVLDSIELKVGKALKRLKTLPNQEYRITLSPAELRLLASLVGGHIIQLDMHSALKNISTESTRVHTNVPIFSKKGNQ